MQWLVENSAKSLREIPSRGGLGSGERQRKTCRPVRKGSFSAEDLGEAIEGNKGQRGTIQSVLASAGSAIHILIQILHDCSRDVSKVTGMTENLVFP